MPSKTQKKRNAQKSQGSETNTEAAKILRTIKEDEAFYFYEAIGKPTGERARSLSEFLEKIESVKLESLLFHVQRKDFQNWIKKTLGDSKLATRIGRISPSNVDSLRTKINSTIKNRIKELKGASITLLVNEDLTVVSQSSTP